MPNEAQELVPLIGALRDGCAWFEACAAPVVVVGGVASSILGRPRTTQDVDFLTRIEEDRWEDFLACGREHGFVARLSDCIEFARKARVLLVRHEPSSVNVDIIFAGLPFEFDMIDRAVVIQLDGAAVPLPTPEDLVIMKMMAQRPHDLEDVRGILRLVDPLDWEYMFSWTSRFDAALDRSDISSSLERLQAETRGRL